MERFAKLFETPTTQVLYFLTTDDGSFPKVCRWMNVGGMEVGAHLCWQDDSDASFAAAEKAFEDADQASAEKLVTAMQAALAERGSNKE